VAGQAPRVDRSAFIGSKRLGLLVLAEMHRIAATKLSSKITLDDTSGERSALTGYSVFANRTGLPRRIVKRRRPER
jgi:hypothetical protein